MIYNFDEVIERRGTRSSKWDNVGVRVGNPNALAMWVADMDFRCPQPVIDAVMKKAEFGIYGYPFVPTEFKEAVAEWVDKRHGWKINPEHVIYAASVIPSLFTAVQAFTEEGDGVILQRPVYYPFSDAFRENRREIKNNALILKNGHYEIDFDNLEELAKDPKTKLMLLCSPHNPTSRVYTREELLKIGEICCRNHVVIFSDEIHSDFVYEDFKHIPIASLSEEIAQNTVTAVAPSKTFNLAGLRAASLVIDNPDLRAAISKKFAENRSALGSAIGIEAFIAAYKYGEEYLEQLLAYLQKNIAYLDGYLKEHMPKIHLTKPEGTYLMWLDCRELGMSNEQLDDFLTQKAAVAMDKGFWFGEEGSGFARMNIACPRATIEKALHQIQHEYDKL
ncbi:pyridoxal phosphate-dependent aminotransferase [Murdochiella sp. Marseille-P8839]|nr:pyridoxal phosphate-dependent aminotransferase [Murdochiella sp. Marseille-P8839]